MATTTGKTRCVRCDKDKATLRCGGCLEEFCYKHLGDHRQELNKQFDEIEVNRDIFRQSLTEQIQEPKNHALIEQIDEWEYNSIKKIQRTAEEARQALLNNTSQYIHQIEINLNKLTDQLRQSREEDDFNEINLRQFQDELNRLTKELTRPSNFSVQEDSTPFISKIYVDTPSKRATFVSIDSTVQSNIHHDTIWMQNGFTIAGGNGEGNGLNQLGGPCGVYIDNDQTMYIADTGNNRILKWRSGATTGQVVAGGNGKGPEMNQLNWPIDVIVDKERNNLIICDIKNRRVVRWPTRNATSGETIISDIDCLGLTMDNNGYLYVCDHERHEVRRWQMNDTRGTLVAGGNGPESGLNQLSSPANIFVDEDHSIYVSDYDNDRVMKWMKGAKEGIVIAGGQDEGNDLTQLSGPQGVIVDRLGTVYVADRNNHRIIRWPKGSTQGNIVVGGNDPGNQQNQLNSPMSLSFDRQGNLYVVDLENYRIQRFNIRHS